MSAALPVAVRDQMKQKLWAKADELGWPAISDLDRATWYENWSKDKEIGGVLSHFMDARKVRVYIKDSLLKPYLRSRLQVGWDEVLLMLGKTGSAATSMRTFDKPHGRQLLNGDVICWGSSRDWKLILISVFMRAYQFEGATAYAAVLIESGKTRDEGLRAMIKEASRRLGLVRTVWLE